MPLAISEVLPSLQTNAIWAVDSNLHNIVILPGLIGGVAFAWSLLRLLNPFWKTSYDSQNYESQALPRDPTLPEDQQTTDSSAHEHEF